VGTAYGACTADPSGQERVTFAFQSMAVVLSSPDRPGSITYPKISHNVYRLVASQTVAYIEFRADGWLYWADVDGAACVDYVYSRVE
jgi:hypothetical protein